MLWLAQSEGGAVDMTVHDDRSLLALQGPAAVETMQPLVDVDLSKVYFSDFHKLNIAGIPCYLTRTGCASTSLKVYHEDHVCGIVWRSIILMEVARNFIDQAFSVFPVGLHLGSCGGKHDMRDMSAGTLVRTALRFLCRTTRRSS